MILTFFVFVFCFSSFYYFVFCFPSFFHFVFRFSSFIHFVFVFRGSFFVFLWGLLLIFVFECDTSYSALAKDNGHLKQVRFMSRKQLVCSSSYTRGPLSNLYHDGPTLNLRIMPEYKTSNILNPANIYISVCYWRKTKQVSYVLHYSINNVASFLRSAYFDRSIMDLLRTVVHPVTTHLQTQA